MNHNKEQDAYQRLEKAELIKRLHKLEDELHIKNKEAEKLKTSFLSNISHEIRTPMNAIIGFAGLLKDEKLNKEERALFTDGITSSSEQLLSIIDNVIQAAKIESNEITPSNEVCSINEFIEDLYSTYTEILNDSNNIKLKLHFDKEKFPFILTDLKILRKSISNLIDNAIKFTENGTIEIGYKLINKSRVQFFIFDTGVGIPKEKHELIFENFRQIDDSLSKKHNGLGMGLSISKKLIKLLGGKMEMVSAQNLGTKIFISLPLYPANIEILSCYPKNNPITNPTWLNQSLSNTLKRSNKRSFKGQFYGDIQSFSA